MGQISFTISLIMIGLFTIAIISFAINFAVDNDAAVSISDDPELMELYSDSGGDLSDLREDAESTYTSILETTIEPGSESPQSSAPFAITSTNTLGTTKNILKVGYTKIFGTGSGFGVFITTLIGTIVFIFGLYIYKTLRGNPD